MTRYKKFSYKTLQHDKCCSKFTASAEKTEPSIVQIPVADFEGDTECWALGSIDTDRGLRVVMRFGFSYAKKIG